MRVLVFYACGCYHHHDIPPNTDLIKMALNPSYLSPANDAALFAPPPTQDELQAAPCITFAPMGPKVYVEVGERPPGSWVHVRAREDVSLADVNTFFGNRAVDAITRMGWAPRCMAASLEAIREAAGGRIPKAPPPEREPPPSTSTTKG